MSAKGTEKTQQNFNEIYQPFFDKYQDIIRDAGRMILKRASPGPESQQILNEYKQRLTSFFAEAEKLFSNRNVPDVIKHLVGNLYRQLIQIDRFTNSYLFVQPEPETGIVSFGWGLYGGYERGSKSGSKRGSKSGSKRAPKKSSKKQ